jgi:hypothetical protein
MNLINLLIGRKVVFENLNDRSKIEYHCHTLNSFDCDISIGERLESYINRGFTHIVITDHDKNLSREQLLFCKSNYPGINVINGIEVSSSYGHIILINCSYRPLLNSLWFIVLWAKVFSCQILIPHPARKFTGLVDVYMRRGFSINYLNWFIDECRYFEVYNPRDTRRDKVDVNESVLRKIMMLKPVIGSDSHFLDDIYEKGNAINELDLESHLIENFKDSFDFKNVKLIFKYSELWRTVKSNVKYLLRYTEK